MSNSYGSGFPQFDPSAPAFASGAQRTPSQTSGTPYPPAQGASIAYDRRYSGSSYPGSPPVGTAQGSQPQQPYPHGAPVAAQAYPQQQQQQPQQQQQQQLSPQQTFPGAPATQPNIASPASQPNPQQQQLPSSQQTYPAALGHSASTGAVGGHPSLAQVGSSTSLHGAGQFSAPGGGIPHIGGSRMGSFSEPLSPSGVDAPTGTAAQFRSAERRIQAFLDSLTPYSAERWVSTIIGLVIFMCRVLIAQGWYIVCYTLGIYLLNLFLQFITPMFDPALEDGGNGEDDGMSLPMKSGDEFRPFIRRLPEFKFWISATRAVLLALFCSMIPFFDIPVFWPILVMYFILLFGITMRRQISHMIKYRYVPWTAGKKRYGRR